MKKLLLSILLLALAIPHALAGEKTITISRNDIDWENVNTVYNITKGGVELVMSGGMNNPNFLLMKQHTTITVKSFNFNIKKIVFHCLDNFTNDNLDPFYWGPTTLHIQYSQTHSEYAGKLTYNYGGSSYDACWNSTFSGSYSTNDIAHVKYPDGLPAGYELMFENEGKPVRFASIDIVVEQEVGDMYELVTSQSEVTTGTTYMLVNRESYATTQGYALSVNTTGSTANDDLLSTPVELIDNGTRVKANSETQFITFEASGNSSYPYCVKAGSNYIRTQSTLVTTTGRRGYHLTKVANKPSDDYVNTKVTINTNGIQTNWGYYAAIKYQGSAFADYAIRHIATYTSGSDTYTYYQFRNMYDQANSDRRVYLYKPAQQYKVTTEVQPDAAYGSISLRDGILVDNGTNWSQKMDTVQFLVTAADGYKISNIAIQAKDDNGTVVETISPLSETITINGTLYTFVMLGYNAHIIATFEEVTYHDINIEVKPSTLCGNVFITEGYVVQNDQVKSYDGQTVVFNVTPNPINPADESEGYYELSYVTVTDNVTGVETTLAPDANGNYSFTMPDNEVTITAYFYDNTKSPLWLLGTANGNETWHTYGPRFNYDNDTDEYYIDAYFKGTGNYGDNSGEAFGRFSVTWKIDLNDNWGNINGGNWRGVPGQPDYLVDETITSNNAVYLWYGSDYENNSYKIPAGIYRIYVGTTASQNKGYLANNQLKVEKYNISLGFDPAGGATAAEAVEVAQGTVVTLAGDLYSKIKAINPNEADANFYYKTVETIDGTAEANTANGTTTGTATLDVVNDGETVTQLEGWNYLGWIVADNTGYYKVISTPLAWIEEHGDPGKTYTVADKLLVVWQKEHGENAATTFWAKDLPTTDKPEGLSIDFTSPAEGQIDYMMSSNYTKPQNRNYWDQSNWIELDMSDMSSNDLAGFGAGKYIVAGSLKGVYTDAMNYKMKVTSLQTTNGETYETNKYCTVNFLEDNLMLTETSTGPQSATTGKYYYFLNPKVQEYATITYAMWDQDNQYFVVPTQAAGENTNNFSGAFRIGSWDYNVQPGDGDDGVLAALNDASNAGQVYQFRAIVRRDNYSYGNVPSALRSTPREGQTPSQNVSVWPIDLQVDANHIITAVTDVKQASPVVSVEYVNVAGMRSATPWQGVNIVLTRYANGTISTAKVVR